MAKAGFTKLAATLGIKTLVDKEMLTISQHFDGYLVYGVADRGIIWLLANKDMLTLRLDDDNDDDDIPF